MVHPVQMGKRTRMSFARIEEALAVPDLIEVQKNSYRNFLKYGLREVLADVSPITDYSESLILEFTDYSLDDKPKYTVEKCKERDATYAAPLKVTVRLTNRDTHEIKESEVFMGDFPLMTEHGTFIINGAERVIVSQLVRSPGVYYSKAIDKTGAALYSAQMIPNRGAWIEYETDSNGVVFARIDRARKLPVTVLLRAMGIESDEEIIRLFGNGEHVAATLTRDAPSLNDKGELRYRSRKDQALIEIYNKLRPGEPPSVDSATNLINALFFDPKRYDLAQVGRYKYNKKLALALRIFNRAPVEDVVHPYTGEVLAEAGQPISREQAEAIQNAGINEVLVRVGDEEVRIIGNNFAYIKPFLENYSAELYAQYDEEEVRFSERVHIPTLIEVLQRVQEDGLPLNQALKEASKRLVPKHVLVDDIVASVSYQFGMFSGIGEVDDIDHLGNRRLRSVGELLQNQIRVGMSRLERVVKERMAIQDLEKVRPQDLINIRPVSAAIKEFFGSSQLSQFMDQPNPLAELTHKRRLSALGPGGLNRDRASFAVRDVHYSHYSRICPIETPEGPNIGLINSLASYARINQYGFIEAPYRKIDKTDPMNPRVTEEVVYMTADEEDNYHVAQANEALDAEGHFVRKNVSGRFREETQEYERRMFDYMDVSPKMVFSVATALIPFLQNDDANRALMGSNMQRQAVPLLTTEAPVVGTGMETKTAVDSGVCVVAKKAGTVLRSTSTDISIQNDDGTKDNYHLTKFLRSNQSNCYNQKPIVFQGEHVEAGQVIADGPSTANGELALGKNPLIGFMTW